METTINVELTPITVLLGHAGTGKTNASLGLALAEAARGRRVTLCDLDVVNPYFRVSDYQALLDDAGIRLIKPVLAGTTLDTPSLTGELDAAIGIAANDADARLIIDVGGDDDGAVTIGRWSRMLADAGATVWYVVSAFRALTRTPMEAAGMLPAIEDNARLKATAILNTSNLGDETSVADVARGRAFAHEVAGLLGLPVVATVVPAVACEGLTEDDLRAELAWDIKDESLVVMPRYVRTPWDDAL